MRLVRLPFTLAELAIRESFHVAGFVLRLVRGDDGDDQVRVTVSEPARYAGDRAAAAGGGAQTGDRADPAMPGPPPPTADEALARSRARREAAAPPPPSRPAPPPRREPATGPHVDREAEVVESLGPAEGPGAALEIDEPWEGYDGMAAAAVVERLRGADGATKGVVALYEQRHKARRTVLTAAAR